MRSRGVFLMLSSVILTACGGGHSSGSRSPDPQALIRAVMSSAAGMAVGIEQLFPKQPVSTPCVIRGGGPGLRVRGACASRVKTIGDGSSVVSFVETWDGRTFHGPGSTAKPGLSHTWEFHVDSSRQVTSSRSFGDFPPQSVK